MHVSPGRLPESPGGRDVAIAALSPAPPWNPRGNLPRGGSTGGALRSAGDGFGRCVVRRVRETDGCGDAVGVVCSQRRPGGGFNRRRCLGKVPRDVEVSAVLAYAEIPAALIDRPCPRPSRFMGTMASTISAPARAAAYAPASPGLNVPSTVTTAFVTSPDGWTAPGSWSYITSAVTVSPCQAATASIRRPGPQRRRGPRGCP